MKAEPHGIRFGLKLPNCGGILCPPEWAHPENLRDLGMLAESSGYHSLWLQDHLLTPEELRPLGTLRFYEPLVTAAYLAGQCPAMDIGIATIILPLREPVLLAKQIATFDALFPGRLISGFGTGRYESEFEAFGASWADRGKSADESLQIIESLLSQPTVSYDGLDRRLSDATMYPQPDIRGPEMWIGGTAAPVLRRTARFGTGWICAAIEPEEVSDLIASLRGLLRDADRDPDGFRFALSTTVSRQVAGDDGDRDIHRHSKSISGTEVEIRATFQRHVEVGVTDFLVTFADGDIGALRESVTWFAQAVMPTVLAK